MKLLREYPLLGKELIEQANRRRTYAVRVVYALVLFGVFGAFLYTLVASGGRVAIESLGRGIEAFNLVVWAQLIGIFLLMPALVADVMTRERERSSLDLLLLTQLRPTEIVTQKLISRFVPMFTFLLLSMPLIAVAYAYGGVDATRLWTAGYIVVLTCLWVGAMCMWMSVDAQKTSMALLGCYVRMPMSLLTLTILSVIVGAGLYWFAQFLDFLWGYFEFGSNVLGARAGLAAAQGMELEFSWFVGCLVPPFALFLDEPPPFWVTVLVTLPSWGVIYWYLRRAKRNLLASVFSPTGTVRVPFEIARLPKDPKGKPPRAARPPEDDRPVRWMDLHSRTMRQLWKVFVFACLVDLPLLIYLATQFNVSYADYQREQLFGFSYLAAGQWVVGGIVLGLMACAAFASERTGQTLDVLLATPMRTRDLVLQKMAAPRRLAWVFLIPMGGVLLSEWWFESTTFGGFKGFDLEMLLYLGAAVTTLLIYPWMLCWLGLWVGMRVRDRTRASITLIVLLLLWVFLGPVAIDTALELCGVRETRFAMGPKAGSAPGVDARGEMMQISRVPADLWWNNLRLLTPGEVVWASEWNLWTRRLVGPGWLLVSANALLYAGLALLLRWRCLRKADRWLGRV